MYSIVIKDDEMIVPLTSIDPRASIFWRCIAGFLGLLLTLIPLGRLLFFGLDDGLWGAIVGIAMLCWAVNYSRTLILRRRESVAERRIAVIWPIRSVKRSLKEFSAVLVGNSLLGVDGEEGTTHRVHLVDEYEDEVSFLCGSWWSYNEAFAVATDIAKFLDLALIDTCSDKPERIAHDEHELTQSQRIRKRGEFDFPDRPEEMVSEIDFGQDGTSLRIPAPGLSSIIPESWSHFEFAVAGVIVLPLLIGLGMFLGVMALSPFFISVGWTAVHLIFRTFNEEEIRVSDGLLTIEQRRPHRFGETTLYQTANVRSVSISKGIEPMIVVKSADQQTALGSALSRKEQNYVCAVIRAALVQEQSIEETAEETAEVF